MKKYRLFRYLIPFFIFPILFNLLNVNAKSPVVNSSFLNDTLEIDLSESQIFYVDSLYPVKWNYNGTDSLIILLTRDSEVTWDSLQIVSADTGIWIWPVSGPMSNRCKLKIAELNGTRESVTNDFFSIIDTTKLSAHILLKNTLSYFQFLRNDIGIYADAVKFQPPQFHPASVASIGMGLISMTIAHEINYLDNAETLVVQTLRAMLGHVDGFNPDKNEHNGFFRHWIDLETGERAWDSEYSSIDTGIMVSGALFCKKYFKENAEIGQLADSLYLLVDWASSIANPETGEIYMTFDDDGNGLATTRPFNEYMIVAWLAYNDVRNNDKAQELWQRHYSNPTALPKSTYEGIEVLTDIPGSFLSSFVIQFPYYLCHYFAEDSLYMTYFQNALKADKAYWRFSLDTTIYANRYIWGNGAGASLTNTGYHADKINDNPGMISSPHIIAGFIPVNEDGLKDLYNLSLDSLGTRYLPDSSSSSVLWRFSFDQPSWQAQDIQGVDYSTMLFGLASNIESLGPHFFKENNDFDYPTVTGLSNDTNSIQEFTLQQNYPNPFNPETNIQYALAYSSEVVLVVYNLLGQRVKMLINKKQLSGIYNVLWDGTDDLGRQVSSGIYIYQLKADEYVKERKLVLIR